MALTICLEQLKRIQLRDRQKMSYTGCYRILLHLKERDPSVSSARVLKLMTHFVLDSFDLEMLSSNAPKLNTEALNVSVGYRLTDDFYHERYKFTLTFGLTEDNEYQIHLTRTRSQAFPDLVKGRKRRLTRTVTIEPTMIPDFSNAQDDKQKIIKFIDRLYSRCKIIWRPPPEQITTPATPAPQSTASDRQDEPEAQIEQQPGISNQ